MRKLETPLKTMCHERYSLERVQTAIHELNIKWWQDLVTGEPIERNVGELLCLVHSEISEALEGFRKDRMDEHLPTRKALEVELADAVIRIFDLAGGLNLDLAGAIYDKCKYNCNRADHKPEFRILPGGKKF